MRLFAVVVGLAIGASAADWSAPEQQLARKIAAACGPGPVYLTFENRSSIGRRDSEIIQNGIRSALEAAGVHLAPGESGSATVVITLSENPESYVWVAAIRTKAGDNSVVMVSAERPAGAIAARDSVPLSLRKTSLWSQADPILDVAVLEESNGPTRIAVLNVENVSLYRLQNGKWQQELAMEIAHGRPWPRDLRGRLIPARDHLLDVYLPGVVCRSTAVAPLALTCHDGDDPWPLVAPALSGMSVSVFPSAGSANGATATMPSTAAFFASSRNFFTGTLSPPIGKLATVPKFYSAAVLQRDKYALWMFAATDGQVHIVDGSSDRAARLNWGSDIASVKTSCGAGWQVLATGSAEGIADSVRAYEIPDRDPVAVSAAIEFTGTISALWTEAKGDSAVAIAKNQETGNYDAYRLAVACSQ